RPGFEDLLGRLDPIALGHLDVDDEDVGLQFLDDTDDVAAVAGLADDLDNAGVRHACLDRLADDLMVIAEHHSLGLSDTRTHCGAILSGAPYGCKVLGSVKLPSLSCRFSIRA